MELAGQVAVVTGGASGIGAAVAERLRDVGARPVVWDVADGADVTCDVSDPVAVARALAHTRDGVGPPGVLVACAGIGHSGSLLDIVPTDWDRVLAVNLKGTWLSMRAVAGAMRAEGRGGAMVGITSVSARLVDRAMGAYCASKAGMEMLVKVAAAEWAAFGIRVNAVGPGVTRTPMLGAAAGSGLTDEVVHRTPLGRLGEAEDVAQAVVAVLALEWVTGQVLMADGGLSLHSPIDFYGAMARARGEAAGDSA